MARKKPNMTERLLARLRREGHADKAAAAENAFNQTLASGAHMRDAHAAAQAAAAVETRASRKARFRKRQTATLSAEETSDSASNDPPSIEEIVKDEDYWRKGVQEMCAEMYEKRQIIKQQDAALAQKDATIDKLREEIDELRAGQKKVYELPVRGRDEAQL